MSRITRRQFLTRTAAAGATLAAGPTYLRALGANDDIRVAVIGHRGQGFGHIRRIAKMKGIRLVAICDADRDVQRRCAEWLSKQKIKVDTYTDMRKVFDRKDINAITTATPNHWHALTTIWACQSGKDVYVEKPVCHNIWEGRRMVEIARKHKRIVQAGTQNRSIPGLTQAWKWLHAGNLGKILIARGFCYKRRGSIGKVSGPQKPPASVDYNLWTGPAKLVSLMRKRLHYDWHWVWNTGNGDIGNQGIHEMDLCRWALGADGLAPRVMTIGGRFGYDDDGETPNTQIAWLDYKPAPLIFEVRGLPRGKGGRDAKIMDNYRGARVGICIECEGGYFVGGNSGGRIYDKKGKRTGKVFSGGGAGSHPANFYKAVRSRKVSDLKADILKGYYSSALCHMGNASYRLGKACPQGEIRERYQGNNLAMDSLDRFLKHLDANKIDPKKTQITLGPWLQMDTDKEQFVGDWAGEANKLITRQYRKPFVVPAKA